MVFGMCKSLWETLWIQTFFPHPPRGKRVFPVFHNAMDDRRGLPTLAKLDFPTFLHSLLLLSF
jgi:hypothetical protein